MNPGTSRRQRPSLVLVADDDAASRLLVRTTLEQSGYEVLEANDGAEAVALFTRRQPDLVLLDVVMPGMDGFRACHTIRELPSGTSTPILMLTGLDDVDSIRRAYEAGATDFVTKPMNWVILSQRVRYMLRASRALADLQESQSRLAAAHRIARLGNWEQDLDSGEIHWSEEMFRIFGLAHDAFEPTLDHFADRVHPEDRNLFVYAKEEILDGAGSCRMDLRIVMPDGSVRVVHEQMELVRDESGRPLRLTGTTQDITERKLAEEKIRQLAYYDGLTQLPNRLLFIERLKMTLANAQRQDRTVALLFLDLDRFKRINDTLGHGLGDRLLQAVADRLRGCLRAYDAVGRMRNPESQDNVARLGGDEFIVSITELKRGEDAARVARRILAALETPFLLDEHEVVVTTSVGISLFPHDGQEVDTLLKNADTAMYHAKDAGANTYQFYDNSMTAAAFQRLSLENTLRKALERDEFELFYQPQIDIRTGRLIGAEALIRWRHPEMGLVSPGEFIPLAEEVGLIVPIGEWVLHRACAQAKAWSHLGHDPLVVSVNLSGQQFRQGHVAKTVERALRFVGLDPRLLEVEITESVLMQTADETVEKLQEMRDMGVGVALDDFGTGYSALGYLKRFPITRLKIDQTFVRDVATDPGDAAITAAIIGMARGLNLSVIAEGVEKPQQLALLREQGCWLMQGYLFGKPAPAEEFARLLDPGVEPLVVPETLTEDFTARRY